MGGCTSLKCDGVTEAFLVESVLDPTKSIRKGFEQFMIQNDEGLVLTGFRVSEDAKTFVLREPALGKELKIAKNGIEWIRQSKLSAMPAGLVNQLKNQNDFYDLVRFLLEVNEGGPAKMKALKKAATEK